MPLLERKLVPKIMFYRQLSLSKMRAFCCIIRLFLSKSGWRISRRVTTCWTITWPDKVLIFLPFEERLPWVGLTFWWDSSKLLSLRECRTIACCGLCLWCWPCKLLQVSHSWEWFLVHKNSIQCHHQKLHNLLERLWKRSLQNHHQWCHTWRCCLSFVQKNLN